MKVVLYAYVVGSIIEFSWSLGLLEKLRSLSNVR